MIRVSPSIRISLGLVFITTSVLLFANFVGLLLDPLTVTMRARKGAAESAALQCAAVVRHGKPAALQKTMEILVDLHPDIVSLGLRDENKEYVAQTKDHKSLWKAPRGRTSDAMHWQVPIYDDGEEWGTLQISFAPLDGLVLLGHRLNPFYILLGFFAVTCFAAFLIFMKKVLRHLDPTTVMPRRVRNAFETLTEGVLLVDVQGRIVLANSAFVNKLGFTAEALMGFDASRLNWINPATKMPPEVLPWEAALSRRKIESGILLSLSTRSHGVRTLMTNSAPILDDGGTPRGVLVTIDDVTELEQKNIQLSEMLELLRRSNEKVERQNKELEILATRDSLTGCLNRRSFFSKAEQHLAIAKQNESRAACIMTDLDHFKDINDAYGHAVGDKVLQYVARVLRAAVRDEDVVGRYGGEEFCILLPNCDIENASEIARRMGNKMVVQGGRAIAEAPGIRVSASFGVSDSGMGALGIEELLAQADKALYRAKVGGRNRVISWDSSMNVQDATQSETIKDK